MKNLTAILCAALIAGAIIYHARTRPGRYYFPNASENMRVGDTATGKIYLIKTNGKYTEFHIRNPVKETFEWPWE